MLNKATNTRKMHENRPLIDNESSQQIFHH